MLTFKRAIMAAAMVLTILYLLTHTHSTEITSVTQVPLRDTTSDAKHKTPHPDSKAPKYDDSDPKTKPGKKTTTPITTSTSPKGHQDTTKKPGSQQSLSDLPPKSLREKLAYQFPYDVETKFPAYIWQTWKFTPSSAEFDDTFRAAEASWSEKHPGFIHEVITDQVAVHLMRHLYASVPEVLEAYAALPLPILKADFFRYLILLARGGIYSDIDTEALKSALDWVPATVPQTSIGLVIGIEADPDRPDWKEWYSRRIQFCQWTIQSKPGHPVLRDTVAHLTEEILKRKKAGTLETTEDKVVEFTGPAIWTDIIFDFFNDAKYFDMTGSNGNITWQDFTGMTAPKKVGDVVVLPITSFSPGVQQMGAEDYDHPMAFVKHAFEGMMALLYEYLKDLPN
jgi:alpha 1,6-mannosyltransferase